MLLPAERVTLEFDVNSLFDRRATQRWNRMAVGDLLERVCWATPDKDAIIGCAGAFGSPEFERLSYGQADQAANRVAHALRSDGLTPGDRVLLFCDNSVEALLVLLGIAKAGLVAAPINPGLAPDVVQWAIEHVEASFAVVDAGLWPKAEPAFTGAGLTPAVAIPIGGALPEGSVAFPDWISVQPATEPDVEIHSDDVWELLFTSGTTAMPKASMGTHTFSYLTAYSYALSLTRGLRFEHDLRLCTFLPIIYHCGHNSAVFPAMLAGGTAILGRGMRGDALAQAITSERATALWAGAPPFLEALVDAAGSDGSSYDLRSLTVAMFSWRTLHPELAAKLKRLCGEDLALWEIFGQTEAMSGYRFWLDQWPEKVVAGAGAVNYVGVPNPLLAAKIVDPDGTDLRDLPGSPGEAVYRSPAISAGYYRNEPATREAFDGGWFHSGDSCCYDEDGLQVMVDRYKDIVKSGGENVSSLRVESVVIQHPAVDRVAVIGLPDERWGEMVTAVVIPRPGTEADEQSLIAFCRARLAGYETPKRVIFVEQMPETVGGKILKYRLRASLGGSTKSSSGQMVAP
jgi:acyl-CoA synthetase (AMP-forming)/AMP-acid ligase II